VPTYEYRCDNCAENFDVVQSFTDDPLTECPTCGSPVRKVFGSVGIVFKGSGFYKTDSRSGGSSKASSGDTASGTSGAEKSSSSGGDSGSSGDSSSGTDSGKSSETTKSPATPAPSTEHRQEHSFEGGHAVVLAPPLHAVI
jgi:putative FmdB family regulatory protein